VKTYLRNAQDLARVLLLLLCIAGLRSSSPSFPAVRMGGRVGKQKVARWCKATLFTSYNAARLKLRVTHGDAPLVGTRRRVAERGAPEKNHFFRFASKSEKMSIFSETPLRQSNQSTSGGICLPNLRV
jgi:hypothetical protein